MGPLRDPAGPSARQPPPTPPGRRSDFQPPHPKPHHGAVVSGEWSPPLGTTQGRGEGRTDVEPCIPHPTLETCGGPGSPQLSCPTRPAQSKGPASSHRVGCMPWAHTPPHLHPHTGVCGAPTPFQVPFQAIPVGGSSSTGAWQPSGALGNASGAVPGQCRGRGWSRGALGVPHSLHPLGT